MSGSFLLLVSGLVVSVDEAVSVEELGKDVRFNRHVERRTCLLALEQVWVIAHLHASRHTHGDSQEQAGKSASLHLISYLPELHHQVHQGGGGAVGLLGRAHGRLQQIFDGDLVPQSLIEQLLPRSQLAVGQDLNLLRGRMRKSRGQGGIPERLLLF